MLLSMVANPIARPVSVVAVIVMSLFVFLLMSVAVTDLLHLIFKFTPQIRGFVSVGLAVLLTVYSVWHAHNIKVKEVTIPVEGLTQEIRSVLITDVHLGNFQGKVAYIYELCAMRENVSAYMGTRKL